MKHVFPAASGLLALLLAFPFATRAQTGGVGIGTTAPDASAALDVVSRGQGLLLPRVAATTGIARPAPGLLGYQPGAPAGFYYNAGTATGTAWQALAARQPPVCGHDNAPAQGRFVSGRLDLDTAPEARGLVFDAAANTVTVVTPGVYRVAYSVSPSPTDPVAVYLLKNGAVLGRRSRVSSTTGGDVTAADEGFCTPGAGDAVALQLAFIGLFGLRLNSGPRTLLRLQ